MNKTLKIVSKFYREDIPEIFEFLIQEHSKTSQETLFEHSIVDLSKNKVYNLEFPLDFDGDNIDSVIKSVEIWEENKGSQNIFIGNDTYIAWKKADWKNEPNLNVDELIVPLSELLQKLETVCDRMCCGCEAFDFRPKSIKKAGQQLNNDWKTEINEIITQIESSSANVVCSLTLNQLFEKSVFIQLLRHLKASLIMKNIA